jgi:CheY-like chemotaxis protein
MIEFKHLLAEHGYVSRFNGFQDLMRFRVRDILLVSSLYDSFILEEDGRLSEMLLSGYLDLNLSSAPNITRVSTGSEALKRMMQERRFDLIITTLNLGDIDAVELAHEIKKIQPDLPVILLLYDTQELHELTVYHDISTFDKVFIWQGDFRTLLAIVKFIEDRRNVEQDTKAVGVQSIIVIEDNVNTYSSFLPIIYTEVVKHTQTVMAEGVNLSHKLLRMRARPKILLCSTYEEAWDYFKKYHDCVLGIISDIEFPHDGKLELGAGLNFAREVKSTYFDIPILLQSDSASYEERARELGVGFQLKQSPFMLQQLREFMTRNFSFGEFVFRLPDGQEVGRADSLKALEDQLQSVPDESIIYHAERNHFSNWLKARTEFLLADQLRPRKVSDFASTELLRRTLINSLQEFRLERSTGVIEDFDKRSFDPASSFARIGTGSLGGKARGLAFVSSLMKNFKLHNRFEQINLMVPPAVVLSTDIFDQFMYSNDLGNFAIECTDDEKVTNRFLNGSLPEDVVSQLADFLELAHYPLAIRSSSLLEDSKFQPFAGIYQTFMLPNCHPDLKVRLQELIDAIIRVYASTFSARSKSYIATTLYRLEEEKMAVIIQKLVGSNHGNRFYPNFSGVARSYNYYPHPPMKPSDGIASVALGLGAAVVDGDYTVRFCPRYPHHLLQFSNNEDTLRYSQKDFWGLELNASSDNLDSLNEMRLMRYGLDISENDGTLWQVASTYSRENDAVFDGLSRQGVRLVTFAPILKNDVFPLSGILNVVLDMGSWGIGSPVELEFAVNLASKRGETHEFALLQLRPLVTTREFEELEIGEIELDHVICTSDHVLGHGILENIYDVIVVDLDRFRREKSRDVAKEVSQFNAELVFAKRPYLLIGVGRWGSADPWLGIPVAWEQISGARAVVESSFRDFDVMPSQGSHFFQNITSSRVGYFTVNVASSDGYVDWSWLRSQPAQDSKKFTRHLRFLNPILIKMDGRTGRGVIYKPQLHVPYQASFGRS